MKPILYLDAGHGGSDSGAVGAMGLREKDVALAVVLLIGAQLADVCEVRYTRKTDVFIPLEKRASIANAGGGKIFVSIHCNSAEEPAANGFEVFTTIGETASDPLAIELFRSYALTFPHLRKRMETADGDEDKERDFAVLRLTKMPAALFELAFISNEGEERFLRERANQVTMATAIARGIRAFITGKAPEPVVPGAPAEAWRGEVNRLAAELLTLAKSA